ncbi:hypothetical protein L1049_022226 [Liquidambar formosana]|uniref:Beta-1,3-glucanase n=1 Tax=Liquidambar formosana TaxID=63359 RepID=A0AAP0RC50_LIQFO
MHSQISITEASDIGVCYGLNGNDLPSPTDAVGLYLKYGITKMRLFEPYPSVLQTLRGTQIAVSIGIRNDHVPILASGQEAANSWFANNIAPYLNDIVISHITVGNEIVPGEFAQYIAPAMQSLQNILNARNLANIKVTTVVAMAVLGASYPPSSGAFSAAASGPMRDILQFLSAHRSPLMANIYPYFPYASEPANIRLDYALFTGSSPILQDGGLSYSNLFDAMLDALYSAIEKEGVTNVDVVVSESGWPSAGNGEFTTPQLAGTYNKNFIAHVTNNGTPKRPQARITGFIFAMFNENLKPAGVEQHWGLFEPNMQPVYSVFDP